MSNCRDCADFGPICPYTGKPCDSREKVFQITGFDKDYGSVFSIELMTFKCKKSADKYCEIMSGSGIQYTAAVKKDT